MTSMFSNLIRVCCALCSKASSLAEILSFADKNIDVFV